MSFPTALYTLLIGPLELFFEILFSLANRVIDNPGLSIIFLSLAMNFLVLPLYKMADDIQAESQATEEKLRYWSNHIKKTFTGDERYMMLQTYYRQNNYKPYDVLKGSVSLMLEIPFFMAAYNFLSSLPLLHGASLGPIQNLGAPDQMIVLGSIAINVLPILMTVINLISSMIYTKGASFRSKMQLYIMAGLFLVLLYDSPSGLVFYWTLNNLFSLVKNIFMKLKNPKKVFCLMVSIIGAVSLAAVVVLHPMPTRKSQFLLCCLTLMLQLPLVIYFITKHLPSKETPALTKQDHMTFWIGGLFLTVLTGMFIPSGVISTSPEEFLNPVTHTNPLVYILSATLTAAGFFLVWFSIFYMLAKDSGKKWMNYGICALSAIALVNFMCFGKDYGIISPLLVFTTPPIFSHASQLSSAVIFVIVAGVIRLVWHKNKRIPRLIFLVLSLSMIAVSSYEMVQANQIISKKVAQLEQETSSKPRIPLSQEGKNIIVLMLDRGVGAYIPYLMAENPQLQEQFAGFTYYPNTVSFGPCTNLGAPALFGGYEYTPEELNKRDSEPLSFKHDEALKVMPVSFLHQGFEVTVCDPPLAGYDWIPDLSIYADYPEIHTFNSMRNFDGLINPMEEAKNTEQRLNRNLFCYSIFKISPVFAQKYIYSGGTYHDITLHIGQVLHSNTHADGLNSHFIHSYEVLCNLPLITEIQPGNQNTFLMLTNDTTHEPTLLQLPQYDPAESVDNLKYTSSDPTAYTVDGKTLKMDSPSQITHYHVNMAAFLKLGLWFDYLRTNHVFDNTRIIIVSDHGAMLNQLDNTQFGPDWRNNVLSYNPLLMVKDFNSTEFSVDSSFMTNADTPTIAMQNIIDSPLNPFTAKPINNSSKYTAPQKIFCSHHSNVLENNGSEFLQDPWYSVHDDIFNLDNWKYLGIN